MVFKSFFFFRAERFLPCEILCSALASESSKARVGVDEAGWGDPEPGPQSRAGSVRETRVSIQALPTVSPSGSPSKSQFAHL